MQNSFLIWKAKRKAELTRMGAHKKTAHKKVQEDAAFDSIG